MRYLLRAWQCSESANSHAVRKSSVVARWVPEPGRADRTANTAEATTIGRERLVSARPRGSGAVSSIALVARRMRECQPPAVQGDARRKRLPAAIFAISEHRPALAG